MKRAEPQVTGLGARTTTAARYLDALAAHGVRWLFGNAGTDFPPVIEALAARPANAARIEPVLVPHENVAMAMAYGAALVTGMPQAVMVHVGLGTANALCGLFNATRQHVPLLLVAGRTPVLESGRLGARNNYINWAQELYDQGGMVRELVKWDYELRDPEQVEAVIARALAIARSSPEGPAYLVLPREVLAAACGPAPAVQPAVEPAHAGLPATADLETLRTWLGEAQRPLLITADAGRSERGFAAVDAFARAHGVPVVQYRPRFASLPTGSPMHAGYDPKALLARADLVLVVDCDVPWLPDSMSPAGGARIVQLGRDPLHARYPMRGFGSHLTLQADAAATLELLARGLPPRTAHWASGAASRPATAAEDRLTNRFVSRCIAELMDERSVLVNEYPFALEELRVERAGQYYSHSPAGGLGWAMGACMGIRLARPEATCIATIGDGTYMFSNPTPAHFVSRARGLPFVTVIFNNRRWAAVHRATLSMYPNGGASAQAEPTFATLEPAPDYERVVEASGGLGLRVERPAELRAALARAVHAVRGEGRQAVVNVLTEIDYGRTS